VWACRLRFTLVSEPMAEDDDEDCIEIGYAYVSLSEILRTGRDLIGAEIPSEQLITSFCIFSLLAHGFQDLYLEFRNLLCSAAEIADCSRDWSLNIVSE